MKSNPKPKAATMSTAKFNALPRSQRAILVSQDVIQHVKSGLLSVSTGNYLSIYRNKKRIDYPDNPRQDAKTSFLNKKAHCTVCARGALFVSSVCFRNELTLDQASGYDFDNDSDTGKATRYMRKDFSSYQQYLIEVAFEGNAFYAYDPIHERDYPLAWRDEIQEEWQKQVTKLPAYKKPFNAYLLISICENIIENKGTFKPRVPIKK